MKTENKIPMRQCTGCREMKQEGNDTCSQDIRE